jgi:predicted nucleic acid-binding protein
MVVIADTSPLNYLILIGEVELLPGLYRRVLIPQAVIDELRHADAPPLVRRFATAPPHWLEEVDVDKADLLVAAEAMPDLDAGELAAIRAGGDVSQSASPDG